MGLQNYAVIPIENSCNKFNNNKINCLQKYDITTNYKTLLKVVQHLYQYNLKIVNYHHIQISVKETNNWNEGMSTMFHCTELLTEGNSSWLITSKWNVDFHIQLPTMFVFLFCFLQKWSY
jgi:Leucine-rich repeat (LRR) protein